MSTEESKTATTAGGIEADEDNAPVHPHWCDRRYCGPGRQHISRQFQLDGDLPLVVEVFQPYSETEALLSILVRDGEQVITIAARQAGPVAAVLEHVATGLRAGLRLNPPATHSN